MLGVLTAGCAGPGAGPPLATSRIEVDSAKASALVSAYRREHGLSPVSRDRALDAVAQKQADAMAGANKLSHTIAGALPDRLAQAGQGWHATAENVSAGYTDLPDALAGWRRSPEHDRNLLLPAMRRMGIAGARAPGTRFKTFWAMVLAD